MLRLHAMRTDLNTLRSAHGGVSLAHPRRHLLLAQAKGRFCESALATHKTYPVESELQRWPAQDGGRISGPRRTLVYHHLPNSAIRTMIGSTWKQRRTWLRHRLQTQRAAAGVANRG